MPLIAFGPVQVIGLAIGVLVSLLGVILYWPARREREAVASPIEEEPDSAGSEETLS